MSFDPYAAGSERAAIPGEFSPHMPDLATIRQRVTGPAIALVVVGVLNFLMAAWPALQAFQVTRLSQEDFEEQMEKQNPQARVQLKEMGWTTEGILHGSIWTFGIWSAVDFCCSLLVILGGIRMMALKNYGIAVFASILAALPAISCSACCAVGEIVGIWALIVLLSAEVRAAFQ